jgi:hypothetical protein
VRVIVKEIEYEINGNGCHIVTSHKWKTEFGYIQINRKLNGKRINLMHRYVYLTEVGDIPTGLFVLHKCDRPDCINISHFFLGTREENCLDRHEKGRTSTMSRGQGEKSGTAKLTEKDILFIRENRGILTQEKLSKKFKVLRSHISKIQRGERWGHLKIGIGKTEKKLTSELVSNLRILYLKGKLNKLEVMGKYNLSRGHLNSILAGRLWRGV